MASVFTMPPYLIIDDYDGFNDAAALKLQVRCILHHCACGPQGVVREDGLDDGDCEGKYSITPMSFEFCISGAQILKTTGKIGRAHV